MITEHDTVFILWCRLTGTPPEEFDEAERAAFQARPQVQDLSNTPYETLLDAGISTARRGSLPLERWLSTVRSANRLAELQLH